MDVLKGPIYKQFYTGQNANLYLCNYQCPVYPCFKNVILRVARGFDNCPQSASHFSEVYTYIANIRVETWWNHLAFFFFTIFYASCKKKKMLLVQFQDARPWKVYSYAMNYKVPPDS